MKFGPGIYAISFEVIINPNLPMSDVAVASLGPIPAAAFVPGAEPSAAALARWRAKPRERPEEFPARIRRELRAEGEAGHHVFCYEKGGFWARNISGLLRP